MGELVVVAGKVAERSGVEWVWGKGSGRSLRETRCLIKVRQLVGR
jgi:hypothetical protein